MGSRMTVLVIALAILASGCETVKESMNGAGRTIDKTIGGER